LKGVEFFSRIRCLPTLYELSTILDVNKTTDPKTHDFVLAVNIFTSIIFIKHTKLTKLMNHRAKTVSFIQICLIRILLHD